MRVAELCERVEAAWRLLSRGRQRAIHRSAMNDPDAGFRMRCKIVRNLTRGEPPRAISRILGVSISQVYRVGDRFVEQGELGLVDRREDNGEAKVTEEYKQELLRLVACDSPQDHGYRRPTWTQELLILVMENRLEISISRTRMSRLLRELEIRLGSPKPIVGCPWKKARRKRRLRALRRLEEDLPKGDVLVYVDEVDIHLNPKIGRDYMLRGTQKSVLTPGKNEKRYLAGALNVKTGKLTWVEWDRKTSDLFILQLWQLIRRDYPRARCIHVIADNFRIHTSKATEQALAAMGARIRLHFLPPYCPDHNPIERVWRDLHDNVTRNHRCRNMEELMEEVRAYLRTRQQALQHQYAKQDAA
jgi:transposase